MTLKELRNGDLIVMRNKNIYMYMEDKYNLGAPHDIINLEGGYMHTTSYDDNFKGVGCSSNDFDIVEVHRPVWAHNVLRDIKYIKTKEDIPSRGYTLVFTEETEVKEMTIAEISKALGYEVKIVKEDK